MGGKLATHLFNIIIYNNFFYSDIEPVIFYIKGIDLLLSLYQNKLKTLLLFKLLIYIVHEHYLIFFFYLIVNITSLL